MYKEMFDLTGRVALVTGGTGNLGSHLSKGLAEAGAEVILASRAAEKLEALSREIRTAGGRCDCIPCDLSRDDDAERLCKEAWEKHGKVDIIVHNATPKDTNTGGIVSTSEADWEVQTRVIYRSALTMFQTLCPRMLAGEGGSIISVVSSTALVPQKNLVAYGMAKGSLLLLTKYVAQEFGPKVRANCITPGTIDTQGTLQDHPIAKAMLPRIAAGRFGRSEECAGAVVFLASKASSYISGQIYTIDGGRF